MSRCKVLSAALVLAVAGCVATAQTTVPNLFGNPSKAIPEWQLTWGSDAGNLTFSGPGLTSITDLKVSLTIADGYNGDQRTGTWAPDGPAVDPEYLLDTNSQTSLLNSFNGTNPNGTWTLFLADLDFGQQGALVQWGVLVTAIPEPSTCILLALGGFALGMRLLQRRTPR